VTAPVAPLAWPPPTDTSTEPRWTQLLLHAIADGCQRTWHAHQQLTSLLNELATQPPAPGRLAPRLRAIDDHAACAHDSAHLHQLLRRHGLDHVVAHLYRAADHRIDALQTLRRLADADDRRWLDPATLPARLEQPLDDLAATGRALVHADHALINALDIPPTKEDHCYPQ
jgi:hypothetical protein